MKITFTKRTIKRLEKTVKTALKLNNLRLFKLAKSLLMVAEGYSIDHIAAFFKTGSRTIYNWIKRFMYERFLWLNGHHYKGRGVKSRLSKKQKAQLYKIVSEGPEKYGFDSGIRGTPYLSSPPLYDMTGKSAAAVHAIGKFNQMTWSLSVIKQGVPGISRNFQKRQTEVSTPDFHLSP